jgi:hypothetical protein
MKVPPLFIFFLPLFSTMGYVNNFLTDKLQAKIADKLIDDTMFRRMQRSGLLQEFMPFTTYDSQDFVMYITETVAPIASIVAKGGEIPTTGFGAFGKINVEAARIALSRQFDTEQQDQMKKLMEESEYKRMEIISGIDPSSGKISTMNQGLVKTIFGSVERLVEGTVDMMLQMAWQLVATGSITIQDPRTNVQFVLNFRENGAAYDTLQFPAPLTNSGSTATPQLNVWTDAQYADGIGLLETMCLNYVDTNGYLPDAIVMSQRANVYLRNQQSTIVRARQAAGLAQVGSVSKMMLKEILASNEIPEIRTFDEFYDVELTVPSGSTNTRSASVQRARFLPENTVVFLKTGMGEIGLGKTIEMLDIKAEDGRLSNPESSLMVRSFVKSKIPMLDELQVFGCSLPVIPSMKRASAFNVY